jgi:hypothetical protein
MQTCKDLCSITQALVYTVVTPVQLEANYKSIERFYSHEWTDKGHRRRGRSRSQPTRRVGEGEVGEEWSDSASSALLVLGGWRVEVL